MLGRNGEEIIVYLMGQAYVEVLFRVPSFFLMSCIMLLVTIWEGKHDWNVKRGAGEKLEFSVFLG